MTLSDPRFLYLTDWLNQYFAVQVSPQLISGDASFRRYFRIHHQGASFIAVDSPPALVPIKPFIELAQAYQSAGLSVPEVMRADEAQGFMLLSDLGDVQLLALLNQSNVSHYYQQALALLPQVASVIETGSGALPDYDAAFVERELTIFTEWLLGTHLAFQLSDDERAMLSSAFTVLTRSALEQPQVGMHRDFHSRNLMVCDEQLSVIDFQDAVIGPITYDAVSLLRDCYVRWPDDIVDALAEFHFQQCQQTQVLADSVTLSQYRRWFDLMGLQRHLKAAGIFARLNYRDNKPAYMADIPLTLSYIVDIAARYPELAALSIWVEQKVIPAMGYPK